MTEINGITGLGSGRIDDRRLTQASDNNSRPFSSYLESTIDLDSIFQKAAYKYNVSVDLLKAIGKAESDFKPDAVSKSGAQGIMQLMPATAAELGVKDAFDPEQNIMGGAKYISDLLKRYDGDVKLALAAYNAGMGNVAKYGGVPPFEETQNYVVKVQKYMQQDINAGNVSAASITGRGAAAYSEWHTKPSELTKKASSAQDISDLLESLFSYKDYLRFIDIFLSLKGIDSDF
jgi:hypothetical protein